MNAPVEPSLLQVMLESIRSLQISVNGVSDKQNSMAVQVATILAQNGEALRREVELQKRVDELETTVSDLKRTAWILTVAGGIVVAIVTSVATEWINARIDPPGRASVITHPTERS